MRSDCSNRLVNSSVWNAGAVVLLGRLQEAEPDRFSRAHLRTLQRRVQQWRGIMADQLVRRVRSNAAGSRWNTGNGAGDPKC